MTYHNNGHRSERYAENTPYWNNKIKKDDIVFHLGDVSFAGTIKTREILEQLNGDKYLIRGNHDHKMSNPVREEFFIWTKDYYEFNINGDPVIFYSSILIVLALLISFIQRGSEEARSAKVSGTPKISEKTNLSPRSKVLIYTFLSLVIFSGLILPISVLSYWLIRGLSAGNSVRAVFGGVVGSLSVSLLAALFSVIVSTPIIIMVSQYRSKFGNVLERIMLALYGLPHISVGVAILFITIKIFPSIYQSFTALIISYLIVFLPQAIGAGQASMEQVKSNYLDASSGLGMSKLKSFYRITLPLIYRGLFAGGALVFLSTMKELTQTLLLRPTGLNTMAIDIWSYASEGLFTQAAFSSFILLAISAIPTYILSTRNLTT